MWVNLWPLYYSKKMRMRCRGIGWNRKWILENILNLQGEPQYQNQKLLITNKKWCLHFYSTDLDETKTITSSWWSTHCTGLLYSVYHDFSGADFTLIHFHMHQLQQLSLLQRVVLSPDPTHYLPEARASWALQLHLPFLEGQRTSAPAK